MLTDVQALIVLCRDQQSKLAPTGSYERSVNAVSSDIDRLLAPKSLPELAVLERQINSKLSSNEPIDVEYWEQLLRSIRVYKSKAELDSVYKSVIQGRLSDLEEEQSTDAKLAKEKLSRLLAEHGAIENSSNLVGGLRIRYSRSLDPEPQLKLHLQDRALDLLTARDFEDRNVSI